MPAFVNTLHLQLHALQMKAKAEHKGTSPSVCHGRGTGELPPARADVLNQGPGSPGAG